MGEHNAFHVTICKIVNSRYESWVYSPLRRFPVISIRLCANNNNNNNNGGKKLHSNVLGREDGTFSFPCSITDQRLYVNRMKWRPSAPAAAYIKYTLAPAHIPSSLTSNQSENLLLWNLSWLVGVLRAITTFFTYISSIKTFTSLWNLAVLLCTIMILSISNVRLRATDQPFRIYDFYNNTSCPVRRFLCQTCVFVINIFVKKCLRTIFLLITVWIQCVSTDLYLLTTSFPLQPYLKYYRHLKKIRQIGSAVLELCGYQLTGFHFYCIIQNYQL